MNTENIPYKIDKTKLSFSSLQDDSDDVTYWHSRTSGERLAALEFLRQVIFGYDPITTRLQRIIEFVEFE